MNRSHADIVAEQVAWMRDQRWTCGECMRAIGLSVPLKWVGWDDVITAYAEAYEALDWQRGWSAANV